MRRAWWPLRAAQVVAPSLRGLVEMRYLWTTPHCLDGARLDALLPGFAHTPLEDALTAAVAHLEMPGMAGMAGGRGMVGKLPTLHAGQ